MLIVVSPAKTLDFEHPPVTEQYSQPRFLAEAQTLVERLRQLAPDEISQLMSISAALGELNHARFMNWRRPFSRRNAKQAVLAFRGDVYTGLEADSFTAAQFDYAQTHLRILSGLYGVLRPLDLIQPYRLEMGTRLDTSAGRNLYDFWGDRITDRLNADLEESGSRQLVNLASEEYFKAVRPKKLAAEVITPIFKDRKGSAYKIVSFYAKKARGLMSAYAVRHGLRDAAGLKDFTVAGYRFRPDLSVGTDWVFTRESPE